MPAGCLGLHWWSRLMGWPMRQELRKAQGSSCVTLLDIALPGGTRRYAYGPGIAALGTGHYDGKLLEIGVLQRSLSDRENSLSDIEYLVTVDDSDGALSAIIEGSSGRQIRGSATTEILASPNVAAHWWFTVFSGVIDRYELTAPRRWQFTIRANDIVIRSPGFPKMSIDPADWPGLPTTSASQYGPVIYGKHNSTGVGNTSKGAVTLIPLDSTGVKFLLQWARSKAVDVVYSDGVAKTLTTDYTVSYPVTNSGRLATVVTFVSAQADKTITADVQGIEDVGDGSGALIELAASQIKHFLVNFVYNDWKNGAWFADSTAPIDAASCAAHAARYPNAKGSRHLLADKKGRGVDELNQWAKSWEARLYWNNRGQIAVAADPIQQVNLYIEDLWLRFEDKRPTAITLSPDWDGLISSVAAQYQNQEADSKYLGSLDVNDPTAMVQAPDSIELPWSAAYSG